MFVTLWWGDEGITLLNSCQVFKELGLYWFWWQLNWLIKLNRFLALQALVEGLGICWATFGLKFPILLNWVRLRPGIWDGGAISSTDWGATSDPTERCLGFAPNRWSKAVWDVHFTNISVETRVQSPYMDASLASHVIWEGSLSMMLKSVMEGKGWWKSLKCLSMAKVVDLECVLDSLTKCWPPWNIPVYWCVLKDFLVGFTQPYEVRNWDIESLLYLISCTTAL